MHPTTTIVIPLYNGEATVLRAIDSVRNQESPAWELLIVDDCSTDGGKDLVAALLSELGDPRLRLLGQERNSGPSACRNLGVREASGDLVAFLDCDDELRPGFLSTLTPLFRDDVDIVAGAHIARTGSGAETIRPDQALGDLGGAEAVNALFRERLWNYDHGRIYRRRLLRTVEHPEAARRYEDIIFNACAFSYSRRIVVTDTPAYVYNVLPSSATWTQDLSRDFVQEAETLIRALMNPEVLPLVTDLSWQVMRATISVVTYSTALAAEAPIPVLRSLDEALRRHVPWTAMPALIRTVPMIGVSALLARTIPSLYGRVYSRYISRSYEIEGRA